MATFNYYAFISYSTRPDKSFGNAHMSLSKYGELVLLKEQYRRGLPVAELELNMLKIPAVARFFDQDHSSTIRRQIFPIDEPIHWTTTWDEQYNTLLFGSFAQVKNYQVVSSMDLELPFAVTNLSTRSLIKRIYQPGFIKQFATDQSLFVSLSYDNTVWIWDFAPFESFDAYDDPELIEEARKRFPYLFDRKEALEWLLLTEK